jgi:hypothetical protein
MSDVDPGAQLSTTDLTEQEIEDAVEEATVDDAVSPDTDADQPHPRIVEGGVGASATGVGTDDLDAATQEAD